MQTVYLLKNCKKSFDALIKLYNSADMSTNIIIVNKFQSKILLLDKRVKSFPFIINTLPTSLGMIPKIAKVLPLEYFIKLNKKNQLPPKVLNKNSGRGVTIKLNNTTPIVPRTTKFNNPRITKIPKIPKNFNNRMMYRSQPMIKKIKDNDGGINIVLKK